MSSSKEIPLARLQTSFAKSAMAGSIGDKNNKVNNLLDINHPRIISMMTSEIKMRDFRTKIMKMKEYGHLILKIHFKKPFKYIHHVVDEK